MEVCQAAFVLHLPTHSCGGWVIPLLSTIATTRLCHLAALDHVLCGHCTQIKSLNFVKVLPWLGH